MHGIECSLFYSVFDPVDEVMCLVTVCDWLCLRFIITGIACCNFTSSRLGVWIPGRTYVKKYTLSCILCVKIYFSLDSDSKYHEDQDKKGLHFYRSRKCPKWRKPRWPPTYIKINIFTNNFATTYTRNIKNMSILMFSGTRKPILSFF